MVSILRNVNAATGREGVEDAVPPVARQLLRHAPRPRRRARLAHQPPPHERLRARGSLAAMQLSAGSRRAARRVLT